MKILITGANGLLGQKLVGLIGTKPEIDLIATSRGECRINNLPENVTYESMDITRPEEVDEIMDKHAPDRVIHTAAMTNVDQCESDHEGCLALNVDAVRHMVQACERNDSFLVHVSTDFIFDGEDGVFCIKLRA